MCTVKVMMRFYVSEHVCYKLYTKLYLQVITFQRKKLWSKNHFQKGNRTVCRRPRAGIARRALISIGPCGRALLISGRSPEAMRASMSDNSKLSILVIFLFPQLSKFRI